MGRFSGIGGAQVSGGNVYFLAGKYRVQVNKVFAMTSRKKEDLFIVECDILESTNDARPVDSRASWVVNLKHDAALGNIKGFIMAAMDCEESEITEEVVDLSCSDENPLHGVELSLLCTDIKTRAGGDFTLHQWDTLE